MQNKSNALLMILALLPSAAVVAKPTTTNETTTSFPTTAKAWLSTLKQGHFVIQGGGYWSDQGEAKHIDIAGLIGDTFTVTKNQDGNGLLGLGYYLDGKDQGRFAVSYGVNGFYLAETSVKGNVIQENVFTNLSYKYNVTHYPVYASVRATTPLLTTRSLLTLDAGIGPNFMDIHGFRERSLDGGITIPDHAFSSNTSTTLSVTAGIGVQFNQILGQKIPLECGYRFYYLGDGHFNKLTNQLINNLHTGQAYANAALCSIRI